MSEIKIDEEKLNKIIKQNEELIKELGEKKTLIKSGNSLVRLKKIDDKLIIEKETKVEKVLNKDTREYELFVYVTLQDEKEKTSKKRIKCMDIVEAEEVVAEVLDKEVKEEVIEKGTTEIVRHEDWKSVNTGERVPSIVIIPHTKFKLKLPSGKKITVDESVINI